MIKPFYGDENLENPFEPALKHYESIVTFMKDSQEWVHNFMEAIPENEGTDEIIFWNDTATNPQYELNSMLSEMKRNVIMIVSLIR